MSDFSTDIVSVYQRVGAGRADHAFVALLQRGGDLGPHTASFTFGATEAEVRRKAADALLSFNDPTKHRKHPADLTTVREAPGPISNADALSD